MAKRKVIGTVCAIALVAVLAARCGVDKVAKDQYNEYKENLDNTIRNEQVYEDYQTNQNETPIVSQTQEFTYFEDAKTTMRTIAESEDWEKLKTTGKNYIVTGIDFIFYDQPINGVYFSELSSSAKRNVMVALINIDSAIMEYYPNYKEEISAKYSVAAQYLNTKYLYTLDQIKEYLGETDFNKIQEDINNTKDNISEGYQKGSQFIKDKYESWRNE
jgi:hypothetical protein